MPGTFASVSMFSTSVGGAGVSPAGPPVDERAAAPADVRRSTSSTPWRYGGAIRGNGGRPSITSSSAGLLAVEVLARAFEDARSSTPSPQPAASTSAIAARSRATSRVNDRFVATITPVGADRGAAIERALDAQERVAAHDARGP